MISPCHLMEHQIGAYTDCNHGCGVAVLHPAYYRHIFRDGLSKFARFAVRCVGNPAGGERHRRRWHRKEFRRWQILSVRSDFPTTLRQLECGMKRR